MHEIEWKRAFGETPDEIKSCVQRALAQATERYPRPYRKTGRMILAISLAAVFLCSAALAGRFGVSSIFFRWEDRVNDSIADGVLPQGNSTVGEVVRVEMIDTLCDTAGGTFALSWQYENLSGEENLYVICDGITVGDAPARQRSALRVSEFLLPLGVTEAGVFCELPEGDAASGVLSLTVLRALRPIELLDPGTDWEAVWDAGKIPMAPDGVIPLTADRAQTYQEHLLATGAFEVADQLELPFTLDLTALQSKVREYTGKKNVTLASGDIEILEAVCSATTFSLRLVDESGTLPEVKVSVPDVPVWHGVASDSWQEEESLDGTKYWVYTYHALDLFTYPGRIVLTIGKETVELVLE